MNDIKDIYPLTIVSDRYGGTYSGANFLAFNLPYFDIPDEIGGSDPDEMDFWDISKTCDEYTIGKGHTAQHAFDDLYNKLNQK